MPDWTDANVHDPGITVLEALVWSLAGLAAAGVLWRLLRRGDP